MTDAELIKNLGGVAKVAETLGFSVQRVQNWVGRGSIPASVKLGRPELFLQRILTGAEESDPQ